MKKYTRPGLIRFFGGKEKSSFHKTKKNIFQKSQRAGLITSYKIAKINVELTKAK